MKVGIDTFGCDHARSGLGSYLLSFTGSLPPAGDLQFELFGSEIDRYTYTSGRDIPFRPVDIPDSLIAERMWHFARLKSFARTQEYGAVIFPAAERVLPVSFRTPGIAVVNSILSGLVRKGGDRTQKFQILRGLRKIQRIIAASRFLRDDLVGLGIDAAKIEVVYNGIDHKSFFPGLSYSDTVDIKPFAVKRPYFIYGSRLSSPEKKHIELIRAFTLFKEKTRLPHRLVLAGDGPYSEEIHKAAFASPYSSDIFLTGFFPHESLPQLYSGADACVFPSVNEGAGLPVLEAMATGIPVACSRSGALPEIGGDVALYFDSDNIEEMAFVLEKIVSDSDLRAKMSGGGIERAGEFNWETTVSRTVGIVRDAAEQGGK